MTWTEQLVEPVREQFAAAADPQRAVEMAAYMKDQARFHGIGAPVRQAIAREVLAALATPTEADLHELARWCWARHEREWQYLAVDTLVRFKRVCGQPTLELSEELILHKSWWDTVDALARNLVGPVGRGDPEARFLMDEWLDSGELWLARAAILHQSMLKTDTDADWLFHACLAHGADPRFFLRKAIGTALRQYARTDADAVRTFLAEHHHDLSPLSVKEAAKHL